MVVSPFVSQEARKFFAEVDRKDMSFLADLLQSGKLTPVIDRRYGLHEIASAIRYLEEGHARGKVVVTLDGLRTPTPK